MAARETPSTGRARIEALAGHFKVIAIDSRGHGRSTRDERPLSYHLMAADVVAVMDQLRVAQASVVGWSDGGIIGLDLAIHHPDRVKRLFAFGANYNLRGMQSPSGDGAHATLDAYFGRCASDYQRLSPTPKDYPRFLDALRKMWHSEPNFEPEQLAQIKVPDDGRGRRARRDHPPGITSAEWPSSSLARGSCSFPKAAISRSGSNPRPSTKRCSSS